jgi:hypothetical protein
MLDILRVRLALASALLVLFFAGTSYYHQVQLPKTPTFEVAEGDTDEMVPTQPLVPRPETLPGSNLQRMRVPIDFGEHGFSKALAFYNGLAQEDPLLKLAALPNVTVTPPEGKQKPVVKKPAEKQKVSKLTTANWDNLTGPERWKVVASFIKRNGWTCPQPSISLQEQYQKLSDVSWSMVYNFGLNNCTKPQG